MSSSAGLVILASLVVHALLLIYLRGQRKRIRTGRLWLASTIVLAGLSSGLFLVQSLSMFFPILLEAAAVVAYGALVLSDLTNRLPRAWLVGGGVWLIALIAVALDFGSDLGSLTNPNLITFVALGGLAGIVLTLMIGEFYAFYAALLPEVANRAIFWVVDSAVLLTGTILSMSGSQTLIMIGQPILALATAGAVYAQIRYRVIDVRGASASGARTFLLLLINAIIIFAAVVLSDSLEKASLLIFAGIALVAAAITIPLQRAARAAMNGVLRGSFASPTEITRRYSQQVSSAVELPTLVESSTRAVNLLLRVRRAAVILVNDTLSTDVVELRLLPGETKPGFLSKTGLIYRQLAIEGRCISQFELEFDPDYRGAPEAERAFFHDAQLSAYAPILFENVLIGILACGAKVNDAPFIGRDFELLATMGHQTSAVLRNARLVADLRAMNTTMGSLNTSLEGAKEQMERLDSVKTDFITIASHELRTPLAQIRGYTEILDALNEQGALEQDQTASMVGSLRKAGERMEELIAAMLDMSQIDVNAMNLHFTETALESIMRMAIEPLTDAIKERKLTLSARGLRGLPTVQADMQRLVQAFRNVVVNALKYTPDGGRIEIKGALLPAENPAERDSILITVTDTGVGIEKENLELVFRKFYRGYDPNLHSTGAYKFMGAGPGLGLTIAQGVINGHGGEIWAESPGHSMEDCPGTTFYICLPVKPPSEAKRVMPFLVDLPDSVSQETTQTGSKRRADNLGVFTNQPL